MTSPACLATSASIALTGSGRNDWDLALFRDIPLPWFKGESSSVQLRIETYNTFNHLQRTAVSLFGSSTIAPGAPYNGDQNVGNGEVGAAARPRILQLGLEFLF
jgi:hypothetical protein